MSSQPLGLTVALQDGRTAFERQTHCFLDAVESLGDHDLLAASRCHGWAVLDVVVHVRGGLEEMLRGVAAPTDAGPTVDAASYWSSWAETAGADPGVDGILWTRRTSSAYRRPTLAVRHLRDAADAVLDAAARMTDSESTAPGASGAVTFQGQVLTRGDLLATWAVELAVHHLDLGRDLDVAPPDCQALHLTRQTVEALLGGPVVADMSDLDVALVGSGRAPAPSGQHLRACLG